MVSPASFASLTAEEFIRDLLVERLGVKFLVVGDDFCFGKGRLGNFAMLQEAGEKYGFEVLKFYPHTSAFYLGDEQGNFVEALRYPNGTFATHVVNRKTSPATEVWQYLNNSFQVVKTKKSKAVYDPRVIYRL